MTIYFVVQTESRKRTDARVCMCAHTCTYTRAHTHIHFEDESVVGHHSDFSAKIKIKKLHRHSIIVTNMAVFFFM